MPMSRTFRFLLFAGLVGLVAVPPAQALQISVQETGGAVITIVDNTLFDTNLALGVIAADTVALNVVLTLFDVASLGATSNVVSGTPFSNDTASLFQSGDVVRVGRNEPVTLTVIAADNDYFFPASNPKFMGSAATDRFAVTTTGDGRTFQSFFDPGNVEGAQVLASPLMIFAAPAGAGPFDTSGTAPMTILGTQPIPFALTSQTIITMGLNASDQFTGTTTVEVHVNAVPEPSAALLLIAGLSMLGAGGLRRWRPRAS